MDLFVPEVSGTLFCTQSGAQMGDLLYSESHKVSDGSRLRDQGVKEIKKQTQITAT